MTTNSVKETNPFKVAQNSLENAFSGEKVDWGHFEDAVNNYLSAGGEGLVFLQWLEVEASHYDESWEEIQGPASEILNRVEAKRGIKDHIQEVFWSAVVDAIKDAHRESSQDISEGKVTEGEVIEAMAATLEEIAGDLSATGITQVLAEQERQVFPTSP